LIRLITCVVLLTACSDGRDSPTLGVDQDPSSMARQDEDRITKPTPTRNDLRNLAEQEPGTERLPSVTSECFVEELDGAVDISQMDMAFSRGGVEVFMPSIGIGCSGPQEGYFCLMDPDETLILKSDGKTFLFSTSNNGRTGIAFSNDGMFCDGERMPPLD